MANRPRRSKTSDKTAPKTVDLEATPADTGAAVEAETSPAGKQEPEASPSKTVKAAAAAPAKTAAKGSSRLPAPSQQPVSEPEAALAEQAGRQERKPAAPTPASTPEITQGKPETPQSKEDPLKDKADPPKGKDESAVEEFAATEGYTRPLSEDDLAEFEDDDTVLAAAEPAHVAEPEPTPYHEPELQPVPPTTGSLIGAAIAGGLVTLVAGGILLYSGILPGLPTAQPAASQFASAGELQRISGDLSSLRETVEQVQSAQAAGGATTSPVSATDFAALSDRVAAAERTLQNGTTASGDLASGLDDVRGLIDSARQTAEGAQQAAQTATQTANTANEVASAARDSAENGMREITSFGERLDSIEQSSRQAATALAAAGLKAAIDRGGAFMSELEAYASASGNPDAVAGLRDSAASGVPTLAELQADWPEVEHSLLLAVRPQTGDAPVSDQLMAGLRSLVTVRPEGAASADAPGPEGAVGRMDAALRRGDLQTFLRERESLPQNAKDASAEFAAEVKARSEASTLLDQAIAGAVNASTSTPTD